MHTLKAGPYTIRGLSVGGIYTSIHVPELGALLDVGVALRSGAAVDHLLLSHCHADHVGGLVTLLGIRGLMGMGRLRVYLPAAAAPELSRALEAMTRLQRHGLELDLEPMEAGSEAQLRPDLWVRAFKTHHPVPSLGYQFFQRVEKLRDEHRGLPGPEIKRRKEAGDPTLFASVERLELAYATDTLLRVIDTCPDVLKSRVLILECSFLDARKSRDASRAGCHVHLEELVERADEFANEHLVLMHFSQIYKPAEVRPLLAARLPASLFERVSVFAPASGPWFG